MLKFFLLDGSEGSWASKDNNTDDDGLGDGLETHIDSMDSLCSDTDCDGLTDELGDHCR